MTEDSIRQLIRQELQKENILPIGSIITFPSEKIPDGFLPCEGQELSRKQYPELSALLGNIFGGTSITFKLPDLQGQFIRGLDREGNVDFDYEGNIRKIGSPQEDALQGHRHNIPSRNTSSEGSHTHKVYYKTYRVGSNVFSNDMPVYEIPSTYLSSNSLGGDPGTSSSGYHSHTISPSMTEEPISHTYGSVRVASETRPANVALIFCIKAR